MQRRKHEARAVLGNAEESELRQRLARYSYQGNTDKQATVDARAAHEAVLATIDTPSERSTSSGSAAPDHDDSSSATSRGGEDDDDDDDDDHQSDDTTTDVDEINTGSSTDDEDGEGSPAELEVTLDDILGSPTAEDANRPSSFTKSSPAPGLRTMGEQTSANPMWMFQEIAARRSLRLQQANQHGGIHQSGGVSSEEESPDRMIQRLLNSSSGGGLRAATSVSDPIPVRGTPLTISKSSSRMSNPNSSEIAASSGKVDDVVSSSFNSSASPGRRQSESLSMIQELHRHQHVSSLQPLLQPLTQQLSGKKAAAYVDPNGFSSLNSTGIAPGSATLSSPPSMTAQMEFKKGRELGRGGFGVVFQAVLSDGRLAAVKQLPATDQKGIDKEMKIMCNLPFHPHCVQYLGTRKTKHHMYMVMEFVSGGSIHALRQEMGKFTEAVAKRYAHMTLLGLLHLHSHHIVHQDIKGGNVLLDERGCAKIADFGCIRELSYGTTQSGGCISTQGGGGGTPLWMAPEVCRGERASTKSDVWSYGCFVLEMLNDSGLPWSFPPGTSLQGAGYAIGSATQPPPFPAHLSDFAKDFLSRCLAVHPQQRAGVEQLLRHPFLTSEPLKIPSVAATDVDFLRTVQSLTSEVSAADRLTFSADEAPFRLEAASDDDDDDSASAPRPSPLQALGGNIGGPRAVPQVQGVTTARRVVDHGQVVWRSAGEMKINMRPS